MSPNADHLSARESHFDGERWVGYRTYVKLVRTGRERAPYHIKSPADVYRAFEQLSACDRERFFALHLDARSCVCGVELVSQGSLNSTIISPREVYKSALLANAAGVIVLHNHPSGDPTPSADDRAVTRHLIEAGRLLDIPLYDHVVIGDGRYVSFAEAGLL